MKKIIAFLFAALLAVSFVACGTDTGTDGGTKPDATKPATADTSCLPENLAPGESEAQCKAYS